jgi:hypothetical protein
MVDSERLVRERVNGDIMRSREKSFDRSIRVLFDVEGRVKAKIKVCLLLLKESVHDVRVWWFRFQLLY